MIALGVDPDTNDSAFAWWGPNGPFDVVVAHVVARKGKTLMATARALSSMQTRTPVDVIAVEGQQIDSRKATSTSLFVLARVAGMCIQEAFQFSPAARLLVPTPTQWKGGVAKHAHQARLYKELGWGYNIIGTGEGRYARPIDVPDGFKHIKASQWKHVGDAILLARWAYEQ